MHEGMLAFEEAVNWGQKYHLSLLIPQVWMCGGGRKRTRRGLRCRGGWGTRPCRTRRATARKDGGVSGVSSSCGANGGFLPRHEEDLREPLVRRQALSKRKRRLDSLEATQGAPRAPRRDLTGERSPFFPLKTRPDSPGALGSSLRSPAAPRERPRESSFKASRGPSPLP